MFSSVKVPRNLCQYRLFRGAADFGNLKQWDLYEKGYSFLTVVSVPVFIQMLASGMDGNGGTIEDKKNMRGIAARLLNNFVYILEHEFRGLTGISGLSAESTTITDGISELQMINKVVEDTSVQISMSFFEKSGRPITKFAEFFLRGIKDSRTQGKTYWGLIEATGIEPGFDKEVFSLLYYVTDNTYRNLEGAYLFMCAQITEVPLADVFESEKGQYSNPEITLTFNAFPVTGDDVNYEAARLLAFLLSEDAKDDRLSGNPNQMNIQSMYSDIDMDANDTEAEIQAAFDDILWFVNCHLANTGQGDFEGNEVDIVFNRDMLMNESEIIDNCTKSQGLLSDETIIANHPWVDDPQLELERLKKQKEEAQKEFENQYNPFKQNPTNNPDGGEGSNPQDEGGALDGKEK